MKQRFRERLMEVNAYQFHTTGTPLPMVKYDDSERAYVVVVNGQREYLKPSDWIIEEEAGGFSVMDDKAFTAKFQEI